jgi:SAM-dependent methyltransferase
MALFKFSNDVQKRLYCPICGASLKIHIKYLFCSNRNCAMKFPVIDGIPVLINSQTSVFSIDDFKTKQNTTFDLNESPLKQILLKFIPDIGLNLKAKENYKKLSELLVGRSKRPKILVIGGGILGQGIETLIFNECLEVIETDVSFGPRTALICDAHDLPFKNESFDCVIAQAVLEHTLDPYKCVEEIYRVLKHKGIVYAETPFMQQVHMGKYDFTRFTYLGHRRLFRKFDEIEMGAVCGPGMALSWSIKYFLLSFTRVKMLRDFINVFARFTTFFLKYFDYFLIDGNATLDSASGFYFMGKKSDSVLSDRDLLKLYKGCVKTDK